MTIILTYLSLFWEKSKSSFGIILAYFLSLFVSSGCDLTIYSPNYLWKNLIIFMSLVLALRLYDPYLKPFRWESFVLPERLVGLILLHVVYLPLMMLTSRHEMFPWFFPVTSFVFCLIPSIVPWNKIFAANVGVS
jgi:hypothetical protein